MSYKDFCDSVAHTLTLRCADCCHWLDSEKHFDEINAHGGPQKARYCHKERTIVFRGSYCPKLKPTKEVYKAYKDNENASED